MLASHLPFLRRFIPVLGERGTAAIEFGLCLPVLMLLVVGATEFGRAIYTDHILVKSVRDSVRYLARVPDPTLAVYQTDATNLALRGSTIGTAPLLIPNLDGAGTPPSGYAITFAITDTTSSVTFYSSPKIITGTLTYPFSSALMNAFGFNGTFAMTFTHSERYIGG